jgi:membrane metallo-endopeptidase-like protein 1
MVTHMIELIQASLVDTLRTVDWMDNITKAKAIEKAHAIEARVAYPDYMLNATYLIQEYAQIRMATTKYFDNVLQLHKRIATGVFSQLKKPVQKWKWITDPITVNAFYYTKDNTIFVPAGILQEPLFNMDSDMYINMAGLGSIISHELTHGFDDTGRLYDKNGNLENWWQPESNEKFETKSQCIIDQYTRYEIPGLYRTHLNGKRTVNEDIADQGGLNLVYRTFQSELSDVERKQMVSGLGLTKEKTFFLKYAQSWCGYLDADDYKNWIIIATHSPSKFRVLGTLSNSVDFSRVFNCPRNSIMNPTQKCSLW